MPYLTLLKECSHSSMCQCTKHLNMKKRLELQEFKCTLIKAKTISYQIEFDSKIGERLGQNLSVHTTLSLGGINMWRPYVTDSEIFVLWRSMLIWIVSNRIYLSSLFHRIHIIFVEIIRKCFKKEFFYQTFYTIDKLQVDIFEFFSFKTVMISFWKSINEFQRLLLQKIV